MFFASPWFLFGALGAAIPVLIHLFGRRRARHVAFPSLMLIKAAQRERTSLVRLRQVWLMVLRALAILLLSLGLARPTLPWWQGASEDRQVLLIIDDSLSMRARGPGRSSFDVARGAADGLLARFGGQAGLCVASAPEQVRYGQPERLRRELAALKPGYAAVDCLGALRRVRAQTETDVYLLTDLQQTAWPASAPAGLQRLTVVDSGHDVGNHAISEAELREPPVLRGRPAQLAVAVHGDKAEALPVSLRMGRQALPPQRVQVTGGSGRALFEWEPERAEAVPLTVTLPPDALSEDDAAHAVAFVRERLKVALVGTEAETRPVRLALAPAEGAPVAIVTDVKQADVAILWRVPAGLDTEAGLLVMTQSVAAADLQDLLSEVRLGALSEPLPSPLHLGWFDAFRPPLQAFANPAAGDLKAPAFRRVRALEAPEEQVMARFEDGTPALVAATAPSPGSAGVPPARAIVVNLPLDPALTDLTRLPVFVPLMHRLVKHVAGRRWYEPPPPLVGETLMLTPPAEVTEPTATAPDGQPLAVEVASGVWKLRPLQPGIYRLSWRESNGNGQTVIAVNTDPRESDLRRLSTRDLARRLAPARVNVVKPEELVGQAPRSPLSLAFPLLLLAFLALLAEALLTAGRRP